MSSVQWVKIGSIRGPAGGASMKWRQDVPAATWTIVHNFDSRPAVVLVLDDDPTEPVHTDVSYPDGNTVVIEWPSPVTGWAELT